MPYVLEFEATDTLSPGGSGLPHTGTSATLSTGAFGSPSGTQILCVDYNSPSLAAYFSCAIAGTALTNISFLGGNLTADHAPGAPVASVFTPAHYQAAIDGTGWASTAISQGSVQTGADQNVTGTLSDLTSLSRSVTVPAGGRTVRLTFCGKIEQDTDANSYVTMGFLEDGNLVYNTTFHISKPGLALAATFLFQKVPTSGSHTYKVQASYAGGSGVPYVKLGSVLFVDLL